MATREFLNELISQYQTGSSHEIKTEAAGGVNVAKRLQAGEHVDVVVLASDAIDALTAAGKLLANSRTDLAKSGVAIAVRQGLPIPDVSSEDAVRRAVLDAKTLSYSTGPSGVYLEKMFAKWNVLETIRPRIVVPPPGVPVGSLVADGSAELGFQQLSELRNIAGIEVIGPLPPTIQIITIFSGGVSQTSAQPQAAADLLGFLASPAAAPVKRRWGMEPA